MTDTPVTYLTISSINLAETVYPVQRIPVPGIPGAGTYQVLDHQIGWHSDSASPCATEGNTVFNGHNPGVFSSLPDVQVGDELITCSYGYHIEEVLLVANSSYEEKVKAGKYADPTPDRRITLITCLGKSRLVVIARPVGED